MISIDIYDIELMSILGKCGECVYRSIFYLLDPIPKGACIIVEPVLDQFHVCGVRGSCIYMLVSARKCIDTSNSRML